MKRVLGLQNWPSPLTASAVTIGKFFALHRGHQALLRATVSAALELRVPSVALTFDRHPAEFLRPETSGSLSVLATLEERLTEIERCGIDWALVIQLDRTFLELEPEQFVRDVLVGQLGAKRLLFGPGFRFGRLARGNAELLTRMGRDHGFTCAPLQPLSETGRPISSSWVAEALRLGDVALAYRLLGRPYQVPGVVRRGDAVGRTLGFPTANVEWHLEGTPRRLLPADGVYVVEMELSAGGIFAGVANLGTRPTVDGRRHLLEVHLLDWNGTLYDRSVHVRFLERLRAEQRFESVEALTRQISADVETARCWFSAREGVVLPCP